MKWIWILIVMHAPTGVVVTGRSVTVDQFGLVDQYISQPKSTRGKCRKMQDKFLANLQMRIALGRLSVLQVQAKCLRLNNHGD